MSGCEIDHLPPYHDEIKNEWNSASITFMFSWQAQRQNLCFVDRASLYNLVNKANFVHNSFFLYLSISTCFGQLRAHHQKKELGLCDTW
jgi:hypothetical protein